MKHPRILLSSLLLAGHVGAQTPAVPDAVEASPKQNVMRFENDVIRLIEVTLAAGESEKIHSDPYATVFALATPYKDIEELLQDDQSPLNGQGRGVGPAPVDMDAPTCMTSAPRAAYRLVNKGRQAAHWYRVEFKRVDGDDLKSNWQQWYAWMLDPLKPSQEVVRTTQGKPFSKIWPYPVAYDSISAAPGNHVLRYEDANIRFIEVTTRPGETENMHGHPYPSVFAYKSPGLTHMRNEFRSEDDPLNNHGFKKAGWGAAPQGMKYPTCRTLSPEAPHKVTNQEIYPLHFYRLEFKKLGI